MKIKLYRSSTVGLIFDNFKILTDPWLVDGEYFGAWSHYPKFDYKKYADEINSYNAIYISHIHPDHCSGATLKKINKKIPVFIHNYHSKFLKRKIENLGFSVKELNNNEKYYLNDEININIIAADNCDPRMCYKFFGCGIKNKDIPGSQQIDSMSVIENKKYKILNVNDCPIELAKKSLDIVKKKYQNIDVILTGYSGAGPYPQCFDNLNYSKKKIEAKKKEINFLNKAKNYIKIIKPKYYLPFAGTYSLSGKLAKLQKLRGVPTLDYTYKYLKKRCQNSKPIMLNYDCIFDLHNEIYSKKYKKINVKTANKYSKDILSKKKLDYESDTILPKIQLINLINHAFKNFMIKKKKLNFKLKTNIIVKTDKIKFMINNLDNQTSLEFLKKSNKNIKRFVCFKLDHRLLQRLLKGPRYAHWNNAEIGSHIKFQRKPNIYERNIYESMCYFHN